MVDLENIPSFKEFFNNGKEDAAMKARYMTKEERGAIAKNNALNYWKSDAGIKKKQKALEKYKLTDAEMDFVSKTPVEELCKGYPDELVSFINYVKKLSYTEDPDYEYLRNLLDKIMKDNNFDNDQIYDWSKLEGKSEKNVVENKENEGNSNKANRDTMY